MYIHKAVRNVIGLEVTMNIPLSYDLLRNRPKELNMQMGWQL